MLSVGLKNHVDNSAAFASNVELAPGRIVWEGDESLPEPPASRCLDGSCCI